MAALLDIYLKEETLNILLSTVRKNGEKGVSLTVSVNDETNGYGQNTSAYVSQTKEQREAKDKKFYVGNGRVFWTDGSVSTAVRVDQNAANAPTHSNSGSDDDLPF